MKAIKRITAVLFVSLTLIVAFPTEIGTLSITAEAHGGRTDSNGGHRDTKNASGLGSYHYHHGYPAHLHTNGICPYENGYMESSDSSASSSSVYMDDVTTANTNSDSTTDNIDTQDFLSQDNIEVQDIILWDDTLYDNVAFNAAYYANKYEDIYAIYGDNAKALYDHFITYGIKEGRQASAQFNILIYKENNPDLADVFGDDFIKYYNHFIECGVNEDRVSIYIEEQ